MVVCFPFIFIISVSICTDCLVLSPYILIFLAPFPFILSLLLLLKISILLDESGNASSNNITINCGEGETIDGSTGLIINGNYASVEFYKGNNNSKWFIK